MVWAVSLSVIIKKENSLSAMLMKNIVVPDGEVLYFAT